ncbi:GNAT family N-acetyltransferase [Pseudomonas sp. UBA6562]|uniref:GNAT family N-acetyltransferase n=1 Tax=Pseudomonas sp. UBA6562 TaxID=1947332 RepID=UPI0025DF0726|nr:GNAT family N-acetyltransferase [Pseudomonas sp. UBA6562]
MHLIDYRNLTQAQQAQALDIQLPPEQQRHAGDAASALYLARNPSEQQRCLVLMHEQVPRGLLLLQRGVFLPAWAEADAAMLIALQVDRRHQGRGLGSACMQALPGVVRALWPDIGRLQLSVAPDNHLARRLYRHSGWSDSGLGHRARDGHELSMSLVL